MNSVSGGGANAVKMRNEPSANSGIGKMSFHHTELALSIALSSVELNSLALYHLELILICPISINVSDNARVFEIYDGIVNEELGGGRRVENVEVIILDPRMIEIGRGVCLCMKGDGVFRVSLFIDSYNVSINPDLSEGDVLRYFILPILIEEDKRVLPRITAVVLAPPISWVIRVVELLSELGNIGDGAQHGRKGNGRVISSESYWLIALNVVIQHIPFNFVEDLRDEKEVFNSSIVVKGSGEDLVVKLSVPQDINCWEEVLCPS